MATIRFFNGKNRSLPGFYTKNTSEIQNNPVPSPYNTVLIIDTGSGAGWGSLGSINGELQNGEDAIYSLNDMVEAQAFMKGGYWWKLMEPLFYPDENANGIGQLLFVKAATTTAATMTFAPTGGGTAGGSAVIKVRDEGVIGNGVLTNSELTKGYAYQFTAGKFDTAKYMLTFYQGTYKGAHVDGLTYEEISIADSLPVVVIQSPEFSTMGELKTWMDTDRLFNTLFKATVTVTGTGAITAADLTAISGYKLASGGTETYAATSLTKVLETITNFQYKYIIADNYDKPSIGTNDMGSDDADCTFNSSIFNHIKRDAKFVKFLAIGGCSTTDNLATSISLAAGYDHTLVNIIHGGVIKKSKTSATGYRQFDSLYKTCIVLGRMLGLPPQVPVTNKTINIDGELSKLTDRQREQALAGGVITTFYNRDRNKYIVTQGINTLQNNSNFINNTSNIGQMSLSTQVMRIVSQVDQTLIVNAQNDILSQENGINQTTLSEESLKMWIIKQLSAMTASDQIDGYIKGLDSSSISVVRDQDNYNATYGYFVNGEITKIFVTSKLVG